MSEFESSEIRGVNGFEIFHLESFNGHLFAATSSGVYRYDPAADHFVRLEFVAPQPPYIKAPEGT